MLEAGFLQDYFFFLKSKLARKKKEKRTHA